MHMAQCLLLYCYTLLKAEEKRCLLSLQLVLEECYTSLYHSRAVYMYDDLIAHLKLTAVKSMLLPLAAAAAACRSRAAVSGASSCL
jgi:hypothetical protein